MGVHCCNRIGVSLYGCYCMSVSPWGVRRFTKPAANVGVVMSILTGGTLRGRPSQRLARALPRPGLHAPIPNVPAAGAGTGDGDSGRPRTDGTGCGVLREKVRRGRDTAWMCSGCASIWRFDLWAWWKKSSSLRCRELSSIGYPIRSQVVGYRAATCHRFVIIWVGLVWGRGSLNRKPTGSAEFVVFNNELG